MDRPILDEVKEHGLHGNHQFVANDLYYNIEDEEKKIFHQAWIGTKLENSGPHWHCGQCYSEDWMYLDNVAVKVCKKCFSDGKVSSMLLCTPVICGSS